MSDDEEEILTVDQLSDDPLKMPPPYWRGSGAIFQLRDAIEEMCIALKDLIPISKKTDPDLGPHHEQYGDDESENAMDKFSEICADLWDVEHKVGMKAELSCLMSAIQAEDDLNQFCVYNLKKDIAETIEKLSPPEKLLVASAVIGRSGVKSTSVYEACGNLSSWRNAFAHGHCVDRPTKSLRHNHLIKPTEYPGVPSALRETIALVGAYITVYDYLGSISLNPYTKGKVSQVEEIRESLEDLKRFEYQGNNSVYSLLYRAEFRGQVVVNPESETRR
jgi:hypothetical protein